MDQGDERRLVRQIRRTSVEMFAILTNEVATRRTLSSLIEHAKNPEKPDYIIGLEPMGFLYGPTIANELFVPFIPIRKAGKLLGPVLSQTYTTDRNTEEKLEVKVKHVIREKRYVIVDDKFAGGNALAAACRLIEQGGGVVVKCLVVADLPQNYPPESITFPLDALVRVEE